MKHNLLKSVILSVILLMGVSNTWAANGTITVYFKNTVNWNKVYAYFLTSSYWDQTNGCGSYGYTAKEMTYDNTLGLYKCTYTGNYSEYITFTKDQQNNYGNFYNTEAVYRSDFSTTSPIYVPSNTSNETKNGTKYYNNGSWVATTTQIVYYVGTLSTPYAYIWNSNNGNHSAWPGEKMTNSGKTYNGKTIYSTTTPYSFQNIIFSNNGSSKTDDLTLNAGKIYDHTNSKWIDYNYDVTVSFNSNGKGSDPASKTVLKGNTITAPTAPPVTGYSVEGWYKEQACTNKWNFSTAVNADMTLYAKWTPATYMIILDANGGSGHTSTISATYESSTLSTNITNPQKDGYTFDGWYSGTNGTGTLVIDKLGKLQPNVSGYTGANGIWTATSNKTLYAKWTINQYTLTYSAGEGGSVTASVGGNPISSPAALDYNTQVVLTATPTGENAFAQWVNEEGVKVSTANPYTFKLTTNTTIKAEFSKPTTVYLKPSNDWKESNAHFAIYTWGGSQSVDPWVDMEVVDCDGNYYKANVPAGFSDFAFVRLKEGGGHDWANKLNQTGNLTIQTNGKNTYDIGDKTMTYIHLEAKAWDNGDARFAAYFFGNGDKWVNLTKNGDVYSCKKPEGYTSVIFCRMIKNNANNNFNNCWNKTKDLSLMDNGDNCFWIDTDNSWGCAGNVPGDEANDGDGDRDGADGGWYRLLDDSQWKTYSTPTYNVTIKPTIHGTYSIVCNGRTYPVSYKEDIVIPDVPMGTVLTIQDVKPNKETEYTSDIIYKESTNAVYETVSDNTITVCGNTTIDENFVTKNAHVVYLRIPSGLDWGTGNDQKLSVYNKLTESYVPTVMTAAPNASNYESGYTYYTCTIPAGTHTIRFEYNNQYQTHDFPHVMPLSSLNCYTIHSKEGESTVFNGYWSELLSDGDYRLLYVEQTVEKDANNKTIIKRRKAHPSDIIPASIISAGGSKVVSLHIFKDRTYTDAVKKYDGGTPTYYESYSNPEVILQQYNCSTKVWEDKESHMVFGPLKTLPGMAMAPGRRNAAADGELVYDDGIEIIKNDDHTVHPGSGVWNFTVKQLEGSKATIDLTNVERYTGEYYIRTDVANGGWFNYNPTNHMTRSDKAKANSNFSHYYCKWIGEAGVNVKFTVANDFGYAISDTLEADRTDLWGVALANKMVGDDQKLPVKANVRFAWNEYSNFIHRAYIAGSANVSDRFLVLEGDANIFDANGNTLAAGVDNGKDPRFGLNANEEIFRDNSNWIYYADVQMKPMAPVKVTAKYNGQTQYFVGKQDETVSLLQGRGEDKYLIRMLYDFKTNQLISAYVPGASNQVDVISTNIMVIRQDNNPAKQLNFTNGDMTNRSEDRRAYGVIEFTKERLIDDPKLNPYERSLYWISFPFDVNVEEAICFGEYGKHWIIQEYNGERRAAEGCWLESESFWDYKWDQNITLEAGKGYVLALDVDQIRTDGLFGLAGDRPIGIYFPSTTAITNEITALTHVSTPVPSHECTINRGEGTLGDRRIKDSHWNVLGIPSYVTTTGTYYPTNIATVTKDLKYYYRWLGQYNKYEAETADQKEFQPMYAYMVQFTGQIGWDRLINENKLIAAKQSSDSEQEYHLRLELHQNGNKADHTFVQLQDEDGVTDYFDFNNDLCKIVNAGANIYTIIDKGPTPEEVAGNVLPIQETIIPVGVVISTAGEYTFAMPDGTDGIVVELIDYENNTRTNLLLDNYTVNLGKGTFDNRFALHVQPSKVTTSVEDINTNSNGVKKYLIDGILYMQKDGVLYDAQGKLVR